MSPIWFGVCPFMDLAVYNQLHEICTVVKILQFMHLTVFVTKHNYHQLLTVNKINKVITKTVQMFLCLELVCMLMCTSVQTTKMQMSGACCKHCLRYLHISFTTFQEIHECVCKPVVVSTLIGMTDKRGRGYSTYCLPFIQIFFSVVLTSLYKIST